MRRVEVPAGVLWGPGRRWATQAEYEQYWQAWRERKRRILAQIEAERVAEVLR